MGRHGSLKKYAGPNGKIFDTLEEAYWETRYSLGQNSGEGSGGEGRDWKWKVITKLVPKMTSVIDVACGDLRFWEGRIAEEYVGIDISKTIVEENRRKQTNWDFIWSPAIFSA